MAVSGVPEGEREREPGRWELHSSIRGFTLCCQRPATLFRHTRTSTGRHDRHQLAPVQEDLLGAYIPSSERGTALHPFHYNPSSPSSLAAENVEHNLQNSLC